MQMIIFKLRLAFLAQLVWKQMFQNSFWPFLTQLMSATHFQSVLRKHYHVSVPQALSAVGCGTVRANFTLMKTILF